MALVNLFAEKEWRCRCSKQTCGHGRRRRGWDKESTIDIYTLLYVKQIASRNVLSNTRSPAWCYVMTWRGRMGQGEGGCEEGGICVSVTVSRYCRAKTNTTL